MVRFGMWEKTVEVQGKPDIWSTDPALGGDYRKRHGLLSELRPQ
jgi:hypothetical protein